MDTKMEIEEIESKIFRYTLSGSKVVEQLIKAY